MRSTYVGELNDAEATEVGEAIVGGILVDNEGDVLHLLGAEPLHHGWNGRRYVALVPEAAAEKKVKWQCGEICESSQSSESISSKQRGEKEGKERNEEEKRGTCQNVRVNVRT